MRIALLGILVAASVLVAGCGHPPDMKFNPSTWPPASPSPPPPVTPLQPRATPALAGPSPAPTLLPTPVASPSAPGAGDAARGRELFAASCAACHNPQQPFAAGKGTPVGPGLAGVSARGEEHIRESIVEPGAKVAEGFAPAMPDSFDQQLCGKKASSAADVADCAGLNDLVAYLASLKTP
ncbi:MAG: c-type cytochrome [Halobacteria archaeon]